MISVKAGRSFLVHQLIEDRSGWKLRKLLLHGFQQSFRSGLNVIFEVPAECL